MSGSAGAADTEAQVLDVMDGLVEETGNVLVVEPVDDTAAVAPSTGQAQGAQQPELVGDRGLGSCVS